MLNIPYDSLYSATQHMHNVFILIRSSMCSTTTFEWRYVVLLANSQVSKMIVFPRRLFPTMALVGTRTNQRGGRPFFFVLFSLAMPVPTLFACKGLPTVKELALKSVHVLRVAIQSRLGPKSFLADMTCLYAETRDLRY